MLKEETKAAIKAAGIELTEAEEVLLADEKLEHEIPKSLDAMKTLGMDAAQMRDILLRGALEKQTTREPPKKRREVRVYTKPDSDFCKYAKELLTERGIPFREVDCGDDYVLRGWLAWATGQRTLPQIFIDSEPIGGFADLMTMDASGELARRTEAPRAKEGGAT